jgi:hypothetical protein
MALIIPPGYLHAVYQFTCTGDPEVMVTTCGHEIDTASGANNDDAPDDLMTAFGSSMMTGLSADYTLVGVTCYIGNDGPVIVAESSGASVPGGVSQNAAPPNVAILMRKRTDLAGRRGRGRFYIPGVLNDVYASNGLLTTGQVDALTVDANAFYADLTVSVGNRFYPPVVLHRSEGIGDEPPPTPVTQFTIEQRLATQRGRLRP